MKKHTVIAMNATGMADSTRRKAYPNIIYRTFCQPTHARSRAW
jgi:hypothetical protein